MYQEDILRNYVQESELRIIDSNIKARLSKDLAIKYDQGIYDAFFKNIKDYYKKLENLNIKYPGNAHPILYIYIVPDNNYAQLLKVPKIFDRGNGGGKPVNCFDLEGFNLAYGISQNLIENYPQNNISISKIVNQIHELSHIIHGQFFTNNQVLCEGLAETIPLYILDYESQFIDHKNALINLNDEQIFTAEELLNSKKSNTFGKEELLPNRSCSFRLSYISSYLLVRGCIEIIIEKNNYSKIAALQYFMEIIKQSRCSEQWLIYDIANAIGIPKETLLNTKEIQLKALNNIKKSI